VQICKLYNVGHSIAVTIPGYYRRRLGWRLGTYVYLEITGDDTLVIRSNESATKTKLRSATSGPGRISDVAKRARLPRD